jgi:hypothetical protein
MNMLEIGTLAYNAGVRTQSGLQAAIAIAMAESGGDPNAVGDKTLTNATWGASYGLWQIRSLKAETGKGSIRDGTRLADPTFNAKSMVSISRQGVDWGPWSTWPLRAAPYLPGATVVARGIIDGSRVGAAVPEVVDAVTPDGLADVGTGIRATYGWISDRNNWLRVAKTAAGFGLLIGGLLLVTRPYTEGIGQKVVSVLPTGKAASIVKGAS